MVFARAGHNVALFDSAEGVAVAAIPLAQKTLDLLETHGQLNEPIHTILARIHPVASLQQAVSDAAYVQESVKEDLSVKQDIFRAIAVLAPPEAILASSTSALPGSQFLVDILHPERALVAHPVNPPSLIPLVELCGTGKTSQATMDRARAFMNECGMEPVTLNKEIEGFILNRLQYTLVAEALHLVGEGYCSAEDIDKVMTKGLALRWASLGPLEVAHLNSPGGFKGFVHHLGGMMRTIGESARTNYPWDESLVETIHASLLKTSPLERLPRRQAWRDGRILSVRAIQDSKDE